jgi:hypothetical protein
LTPQTAAVLDRACNDCHSNQTRWPWYTNVAPVSWFVINHVNEGRRKMNFSDWAQYSQDEQARLFKKICREVKSGGCRSARISGCTATRSFQATT